MGDYQTFPGEEAKSSQYGMESDFEHITGIKTGEGSDQGFTEHILKVEYDDIRYRSNGGTDLSSVLWHFPQMARFNCQGKDRTLPGFKACPA